MVYQPAQMWGNVPSVNKTPYADVNGRKDIALYFVMLPTWIPKGAHPRGQPTDFGHNLLRLQGSGTRWSRTSNWSQAQTVPGLYSQKRQLITSAMALKHQNTNAKWLWLDRTKRQTPHMYASWLTIGLAKEKVVQVYQ